MFVTSLAVPDVVVTAIIGIASSALTALPSLWYERILSSPFAIAQAALQQSIGEPPPRAIAKSALMSRIILTQASTLSVVGFGRTALKIPLIFPPLIFTNSSAMPFFVKLFPQTSTPFLPPISSMYFSISFLFPLPKTSFTGSLNSHSISLSPFKKFLLIYKINYTTFFF